MYNQISLKFKKKKSYRNPFRPKDFVCVYMCVCVWLAKDFKRKQTS